MITGTTRFDLSRDFRANDRRVVAAMNAVPQGARVILDFGSREVVDYETVDHLRQYVAKLCVDVQGEPGAVRCWVNALRGEDLSTWGRRSA